MFSELWMYPGVEAADGAEGSASVETENASEQTASDREKGAGAQENGAPEGS
jgi:hypothetical protein